MKKILSVALSLVILCASAVSVSARGKVNITLNGEAFTSDTEPFIENNRTYVPVRAIFQAVGASVLWDSENQTVIIAKSNGDNYTNVALQIGLDYAFVNAERVEIDAPSFIENNRTYVPLAFIMTALGENVQWNGETSTVSITTD